MCECPHETFWTLFFDLAHWEFELFLIALFDVALGMVIWPFLKRYWSKHHKHNEDCK